jgi:hypothetical protein
MALQFGHERCDLAFPEMGNQEVTFYTLGLHALVSTGKEDNGK